MRLPPTIDTRSPWYEAFAPQAVASAGRPAAPEAPAFAAPEEQPEPEWATEVLFDCYNE